ncbi:unnamed protein product [Moneuplotes crassus]|uniref:Uncharacterized protein n=1 Tax=Euplotes crassus TaxID=5936 RepID=A0AAD2D8G0_EUPCR|nr:unnamed protein product [Moneuplotes crassus]
MMSKLSRRCVKPLIKFNRMWERPNSNGNLKKIRSMKSLSRRNKILSRKQKKLAKTLSRKLVLRVEIDHHLKLEKNSKITSKRKMLKESKWLLITSNTMGYLGVLL